MSTDESRTESHNAVDCVFECPYFDSVSGTCGHELNQTLVKQFIDNPGCRCPIYDDWRAD